MRICSHFHPFGGWKKSALFVPLRCSLYGGLYRAILGEFFEAFFRSLSTRDGFLTLPNDDLAGFAPDIGKG